MKQKVFIEFGVGNDFKDIKEKALYDYYTITIDKRPASKNYKKNSDFVDQYIIGDWNDDYDIPKADEWCCISCFEHILPEEIDKSINGIIKKIKHDSIGKIHVDLTDHLGGFNHYDDQLYKEKKYNSRYVNRIKYNEWKNIFCKYFTFKEYSHYFEDKITIVDSIHPRGITLIDVKLIK